MELQKMLCRNGQNLREVLKIIDANCKGTAIVVDCRNQLRGVITDGDIRRALLKGAALNQCVDQYMNRECVYAYSHESATDILNKFSEKIKILPIVDKDRNVVNYYEFRNDVHVPVAQPQLGGNELKYLTDALLSTWISSTGTYITEFEEKFSHYCGVKYGVAVSSGTAALHLALASLGIGRGDEVIVPNLTFAATINAVLYTGATPVIVDIEADSWCIDPKEIQKAVTRKTKAIIPVHLYGQPCNMDAIAKIAQDFKLSIVEDCAEAHGATYGGRKVGSFGAIGCFSFFGNKVITTGEGGMCVTDSYTLYCKMRQLRDHGMSKTKKYYHDVIGFNYRMTNLQAAIGVAQFENIDKILEQRNLLEQRYKRILNESDGILWQNHQLPKREAIVWLVSVLVPAPLRDRLIEKLKKQKIDARPFFIPLSEMDIYKQYAFSDTNSKSISRQGINFPTILSLEDETILEIKNIWEELYQETALAEAAKECSDEYDL